MNKRVMLVLGILLLSIAVVPVWAQKAPPPPQYAAVIEHVVNAASCILETPFLDPQTLGDLGDNDNPSESDAVLCNNEMFGVVYSKYAGDGDNTRQSLEGRWELRDDNHNLLPQPAEGYDFKVVNRPETDGLAVDTFSYQLPGDGRQYRLCVERAVYQLPEGNGGLPILECWTFVTSPDLTFMPLIMRDADSCIYNLHIYSANENDTDEWYCFTAEGGNTYAELRFAHSEVVYVEWTDANGKRLESFPGSQPEFYLDTEPIGYTDYPRPFAEMSATKYYPNGPGPWLAQSNLISGQYIIGGVTYYVTVPALWDP